MFIRKYWYRCLFQVIAVADHVTSVLSILSSNFETVTSPSGVEWCSVDKPQVVVQMPCGDSMVSCAMECLKDGCCLLYQFKKNSFTCELFEYTTTNFNVIPSCSSQGAGQPAVTQRSPNPRFSIYGSNGQCTFKIRGFFVVHPTIRRVFDCQGGNPGDNVVMMSKNLTKTSQLWYFDDQGFLRSSFNEYGIEPNTSNINIMAMKPFTGSTNQQWFYSTNLLLNNFMGGQCLAIKGGVNADGAVIQPWACTVPQWNQIWSIEYP